MASIISPAIIGGAYTSEPKIRAPKVSIVVVAHPNISAGENPVAAVKALEDAMMPSKPILLSHERANNPPGNAHGKNVDKRCADSE